MTNKQCLQYYVLTVIFRYMHVNNRYEYSEVPFIRPDKIEVLIVKQSKHWTFFLLLNFRLWFV